MPTVEVLRASVDFPHTPGHGNFYMEMVKTTYARRVDSAGRVVIPVKLRAETGIATGDLVEFYVTKDANGNSWLCIPFGNAESAIQKALREAENAP